MPLLWFSGVCEGYPCPDCVCAFFKHGLMKNLQFQGWGWFQFSEVSAALGFVFEQPNQRGMLLSGPPIERPCF